MDVLIDIETLPDLGMPTPERIELARATRLKAYPRSKPETIDKWLDEPGNTEATWLRTSVQRLRLRVLTVAMAVDMPNATGATVVLSAEYPREPITTAEADAIERGLMERVAVHLGTLGVFGLGHGRPRWVSYNGNGFDFPALAARAVKYGLKDLGEALPTDKWGKDSLDLAIAWKGTDYRGQMDRLTDVVRYLGGAVQGGIDGAGVYDAWRDARMPQIEAHCHADIADLRYVLDAMRSGGMIW